LQTPLGQSVINDTADAVKVLLVDSAGAAITAGSEYTHNDTDSTPSGIVSMWHDTADAIRATSATYPFPVAVKSVIAGTSPTSIGKEEDTGHVTGDTLVGIAGRRLDTPANSAGANGDYCTVDVGADGGVYTHPIAAAVGGCETKVSDDLDETEEDIKLTAGTLYGALITNVSASRVYINFYNATAANVTVGTTAPLIRFGVPAGASAVFAPPACGIKFSTAISMSATTNLTTGAPGVSEVQITAFYK
jgi:hypothetical protein